ncbi:proline-rich protein 2-like [Colius striatus]|uniref:proline-rich protein 2-like n=1 Tax=Colius striatus TaxID=57412 RepID=UPI002B1D9C05|nr:proline-rich protein 2-like [Colius striatus]
MRERELLARRQPRAAQVAVPEVSEAERGVPLLGLLSLRLQILLQGLRRPSLPPVPPPPPVPGGFPTPRHPEQALRRLPARPRLRPSPGPSLAGRSAALARGAKAGPPQSPCPALRRARSGRRLPGSSGTREGGRRGEQPWSRPGPVPLRGPAPEWKVSPETKSDPKFSRSHLRGRARGSDAGHRRAPPPPPPPPPQPPPRVGVGLCPGAERSALRGLRGAAARGQLPRAGSRPGGAGTPGDRTPPLLGTVAPPQTPHGPESRTRVDSLCGG